MALFEIGPQDLLYYEYQPAEDAGGFTFVFFNALTGDTNTWETVIGPQLRGAGHGTLAYNFRGQAESSFSKELELSNQLIVDDAVKLLEALKPPRAILVGLSIGGLFAAQTWLRDIPADGLILINTLRKSGPRLQWIGDALVRAAEVGGLDLFRDLFLPLLMNEDWQLANRASFLKPNMTYQPLPSDAGHYKLLAEAGRGADWDLPYEKLNLPVLVVTGLQDHVFLELEVVGELCARFSNVKRVDMPTAGHLIPNERPEELATIFLDFVKEL